MISFLCIVSVLLIFREDVKTRCDIIKRVTGELPLRQFPLGVVVPRVVVLGVVVPGVVVLEPIKRHAGNHCQPDM